MFDYNDWRWARPQWIDAFAPSYMFIYKILECLMEVMSYCLKKDRGELYMSSISDFMNEHRLPLMPTICLFVLNRSFEPKQLAMAIDKTISLGTIYLSSWGPFSGSDVEDLMDDVILDFQYKTLSEDAEFLAVTITQKGEPVADVAWFLMRTRYFEGIVRYRYLVLYDDWNESMDSLKKELIACLDD